MCECRITNAQKKSVKDIFTELCFRGHIVFTFEMHSFSNLCENGATYRLWLSLGRKQMTVRILQDGEVG